MLQVAIEEAISRIADPDVRNVVGGARQVLFSLYQLAKESGVRKFESKPSIIIGWKKFCDIHGKIPLAGNRFFDNAAGHGQPTGREVVP